MAEHGKRLTTGLPSAQEQLANLSESQQTILFSIQAEITLLNSRIAVTKNEVKSKKERIEEIELVKQLRKDERSIKRMSSRLRELESQFNGVFNFATGYNQSLSLYDKYQSIFKEMDEEDALIAAANSGTGNAKNLRKLRG